MKRIQGLSGKCGTCKFGKMSSLQLGSPGICHLERPGDEHGARMTKSDNECKQYEGRTDRRIFGVLPLHHDSYDSISGKIQFIGYKDQLDHWREHGMIKETDAVFALNEIRHIDEVICDEPQDMSFYGHCKKCSYHISNHPVINRADA